MTDYIETKTNDGTPIRIEIESVAKKVGAGFSPHAADGDGGAESENAYTQTLNTIRACANGVVETLQDLESPPSAASIEFAIKVDAKAGVLIAKVPGDSHFKVSLSWKQVEPEKQEEESKSDD
jgi:hypothetical protein